MTRAIKAYFLALFAACPTVCRAGDLHLSIPLQDGKLSIDSLENSLEIHLGLPHVVASAIPKTGAEFDFRDADRWLLVRSLHAALHKGFGVEVEPGAMTISIDASQWPSDWNQACDALRRFTAAADPGDFARQQIRFGLHLSEAVDPDEPLVILIHGLDGDSQCCADLQRLLTADGFQTATFAYPGEQPLEESAQLLAQNMIALHNSYPPLKVELVTESMGGLVARRYVEGPDYAGGVDHFIMVAPPNQGSGWTWGAWIMKLAVNAVDWKTDPDWSPTWMITEGLCQAEGDLRPASPFLRALNAQPRRDGVKYTILAGDRPELWRYEANGLAFAEECLNSPFVRSLGTETADGLIDSCRRALLDRAGRSDGPVRLTSARLTGVSDFVVLHADHVALYESVDGQDPASWPVIENRLKN